MAKINSIIVMFIALIIGVSFISPLYSLISPQSELSSVTDELIDISGARLDGNNINETYTFNVEYDQSTTGNTPISSFLIDNGTTSATVTTDYVLDEDAGSFTLKNSTYWVDYESNDSYVNYDYKASEYIENSSISRTLLSLIVGLFVISLLIYVLSWIMKLFAEEV
jgi:hypothetical protein